MPSPPHFFDYFINHSNQPNRGLTEQLILMIEDFLNSRNNLSSFVFDLHGTNDPLHQHYGNYQSSMEFCMALQQKLSRFDKRLADVKITPMKINNFNSLSFLITLNFNFTNKKLRFDLETQFNKEHHRFEIK